MWPYDYFNQYSALINEFRLERNDQKEKTRTIFVAVWFEGKQWGGERVRFFKELLEEINSDLDKERYKYSDRFISSESPSKYRFDIQLPPCAKGDINTSILANIMETSIIICDLTPVKKLNPFSNKKFILCDNVLVELGLALAWKMPEQVIVLWDSGKFKFSKLPLDIQGYFLEVLDFKKEKSKIKEIIVRRTQAVESKKNIIIENIERNMDGSSLEVLGRVHALYARGVPFTFIPQDIIDRIRIESALRHLLNLGILQSVVFPLSGSNPKFTWVFILTDLGRFYMSQIKKIKLVPKIFTDFLLISWWDGHKADHPDEYALEIARFNADYGIPWDYCDKFFKDFCKSINIQICNQEGAMRQNNDIFNDYCEGKTFEQIMDDLIKLFKENYSKKNIRR